MENNNNFNNNKNFNNGNKNFNNAAAQTTSNVNTATKVAETVVTPISEAPKTGLAKKVWGKIKDNKTAVLIVGGVTVLGGIGYAAYKKIKKVKKAKSNVKNEEGFAPVEETQETKEQ